MADNVAITAGSGTSVAADDIGSVFYQRVKVTLGPDATATADLQGTAAGAAYVQAKSTVTRTSWTPVVSASAYTAGKVVGTAADVTLTLPARLRALTIASKALIAPVLTLVLIDVDAAVAVTDTATFDPDDADLPYIYATIPVAAADWAQFNDNSFATVALDRVLPTGVGSADVYAVLVAGGSFSLASTSDLTLHLTTEAL